MTTWTPKTQQPETWTGEDPAPRVFSQVGFSHAYYSGKRVFALGSPAGIWDVPTVQTETWTEH